MKERILGFGGAFEERGEAGERIWFRESFSNGLNEDFRRERFVKDRRVLEIESGFF